MTDCVLCDLPDAPANTPFAALLSDLDPADQVLMKTKNAYVIADVAPISIGHCLVVPRVHRPSIGHCTPEELTEISALARRVGDRIARGVGVTVQFEHGMCDSPHNDPAQSCSITHAHLHVAQVSLAGLTTASTACPFLPVDGLASLRKYIDTGYIYLQQQGYERGYLSTSKAVRSQLLRRHFISELHGDDSIWNWHDSILFVDSDSVGRLRGTLSLFKTGRPGAGRLATYRPFDTGQATVRDSLNTGCGQAGVLRGMDLVADSSSTKCAEAVEV